MIPGVAPAQLQINGHERSTDIISIQSQVIYGCVGNNIALPTLTRHGWNVLAVPTFLLSNTPDYSSCYGGEISDEWFSGFLQGIHDRGQDNQLRAVITGYLGSTSKAQHLERWLSRIVDENQNVRIVVDPVLGDEDTGFYVDPNLVDIYREYLLPLATGLTPNRFELGCLSGKTLTSERDVISAARSFLSERTRWVVVTSATQSVSAGTLQVVCVTAESEHIVEHKSYAKAPKGTGDLFTAELTNALLRGLTLELATEQACEFTQRCVFEALMKSSGILAPYILDSGEQSA
ncbi:UNVERIFIED_ORG: pyridoxine kinase [Buttiauxella agrestis ATCC 33320]